MRQRRSRGRLKARKKRNDVAKRVARKGKATASEATE